MEDWQPIEAVKAVHNNQLLTYRVNVDLLYLHESSYGHQQGSKAVERFCEDAYHLGVKYVTVYAFSTENWSRPKEEIDTLMGLLRDFLKECIDSLCSPLVRIIRSGSGISVESKNL